MCQVISTVTMVLVIISMVSAKCDMMREFSSQVDDLSSWAIGKCAGSSTLSDSDIAKAKSCYTKNIQPLMTSASGKTINSFVLNKIFSNSSMKKICTDRKVQDSVKKGAMKDIGMKRGMESKKEIEANCPKFKSALSAFSSCIKS